MTLLANQSAITHITIVPIPELYVTDALGGLLFSRCIIGAALNFTSSSSLLDSDCDHISLCLNTYITKLVIDYRFHKVYSPVLNW